ncbi:MAG: DUF421 domain-containing protein [Firmicutes bacterium]|jgi:uncharacterized membrane protein YcaP (DUF421 family)|nr:DUF421 domain-containing protein [Bacillota bacterium]
MDSPVFIAFYRTLVFYFTLVAAVRVMGKRELANLAPTDLVVAILLAELAIIPIQAHEYPIWVGIVPIITIVCLQILLSSVALKNLRVQAVLDGTPSVLIRSGKIDMKAMRANRYAVDELLAQLRLKGVPDIADVEVAILESNGELSVIPKSQKRAVTPEDLGLETRYEGLPHTLIIDGVVLEKSLEEVGLSREWLEEELRRLGVEGGPENVLLASLNTAGELFYQVKEED